MEDCLVYLNEAQSYIDSFIPISLANSFFEATDDDKRVNDHNEKATSGAIGALSNVYRTLIKNITSMMDQFKNFINTIFMSKERKERYEEFKEMIRSDPILANRKINMQDFKGYEAAYDKALKAIDDEAKKANPSTSIANDIISELNTTINELVNNGKNMSTNAAHAITLKAAADLADHNSVFAKAINTALKSEKNSLEDAEKSLGGGVVNKFKNDLQRHANNGFLHRWKVKILYHKQNTFCDFSKRQLKMLLDFTNIKNGKIKNGKKIIDSKSVVKGIAKHPIMTVQTVGGPKNAVKLAGKAAKLELGVLKGKSDAKAVANEGKNFIHFMTGK